MDDPLDNLTNLRSGFAVGVELYDVNHIHRVDPRLVHATLLEAWVPSFDVRHLVVADASVAEDSRRRTIFEMSARDLEHLHFVQETEVVTLVGQIPKNERVIIVYGTLEGFACALAGGLTCQQMILGHLPAGEGKWRVHPSVYLGDDDFLWIDRIRRSDVEVIVQPLPTDRPMGIRRDEVGRPVLTEDSESGSQDLDPGLLKEDETHVREGLVSVVNERGLHLRAAHLLAQRAGEFTSTVEVTSEGRTVNAKSLLGLTTLGAALGTELELRVEGADAPLAYQTIVLLFESGFEEGVA